jgi:deoxyribonuclease V
MISPEKYQDLSPAEAIAYQHELRKKIQISELKSDIRLIGGADISFNKYEDTVYAGIVVLNYPDLKPVASVTIKSTTRFPYLSGLLAFREIPALLIAWDKLQMKPDLMVLDGQGIAHRRRVGIATHFGLLTDVPSIGSAKSVLTGRFEMPGNKKFASSLMYDREEEIGVALISKVNCKPIYISPGHKINITQSLEIIKSCVGNYRIPEPTRLAHILVNQARTGPDPNGPGQQSLF